MYQDTSRWQWQSLLKNTILFGNEPSWELLGILTVYFVQGVLGLARLAISFFLKDELGLSPAQMAALLTISVVPWIAKPLFGFISDALPLFGYRRRSYLVVSGLLGSLAWIALSTVVHSSWAATLCILTSSLSVAISDVIADSVVVERARGESLDKAGSLQSVSWGFSALGGLLTAYLGGWLLERYSTQVIFAITSVFPLLVSAIAVLIAEEQTDKKSSFLLKEQASQIWQTLKRKTILMPTLFIFLWQATPSADSAFFFFSTNELGFEPEFLGRVRLITSVASLLGIWAYQKFLKSIPFRVILGWSTIISSLLGMTTLLLVTHTNRALGINDYWFSLGDSLILTVMGQIAFIPVLVLSARLCPSGIEATFFAILMSIFNLSGLVSGEGGALLTHWLGITESNFDRLWLLVLISNLSSLVPLIFIKWLPVGDPQALSSKQIDGLPTAEIFDSHSLYPKFMADTKLLITKKND
jgi:folate/biopterin transporter